MKNERGAVLIVTTMFMVVAAGFMALSVDLGRLYVTRSEIQTAADAGALAGAALLHTQNPNAIENEALKYVEFNGANSEETLVHIDDDYSRVIVQVGTLQGWVIAQAIWNRDSAYTSVSSAADLEQIVGIRGAQPWGVELGDFAYGDRYTLKVSGDGEIEPRKGNFQALALDGTGADRYRNHIIHGYSGVLSVGQEILTEPGDMRGPTRQGLKERIDQDPTATFENVSVDSPRILYVPIVESFEVEGRKHVTIVGFAAFFLENIQGTDTVYGRFMKKVVPGETAPLSAGYRDYGLYGVRLSQ